MSGQPAQTKKAGTTAQTNAPPEWAAPYWPQIAGAGSSAFGQNQATPVPGSFVAGATPAQWAGAQGMINAAPMTGAAAPALTDMAQKVASGYFLDPSNDPTFKGAVNAAISPITQQLTNTILPGIVGGGISASGGGGGPTAYGGAGLNLTEEQALNNWGIQTGNIASSMANASRNAGIGLIPQAAGIAQGAGNVALAPAATTEAAGGIQQQLAQSGINDTLARWTAMLQQPWQGLQPFANLLTSGGYGTRTGTTDELTTGTPPSLATQWLQGITGGASSLASLFGAPKGGTSAAGGIWDMLKGLGAPAAA